MTLSQTSSWFGEVRSVALREEEPGGDTTVVVMLMGLAMRPFPSM